VKPAKPYHQIPIVECGEALVEIPADHLCLTTPHPYQALGAPYEGHSPWRLRQSVLVALLVAQNYLQALQPQARLKIFDAWRPNAVQHFMVQREFLTLSGGQTPEAVAPETRTALFEQVYRIWAIPSDDPATPPPHSTGAAVDLTIADNAGQEWDMGSPIDENSPRSQPDFFAATQPQLHARREILYLCMSKAGFARHPHEWWHFSLGDQMWALAMKQSGVATAVARYGRIE
jgi:zinc D-Ala-D-Ala dipeptidase